MKVRKAILKAQRSKTSNCGPEQDEADSPSCINELYNEVFASDDPYWNSNLLRLAERYIKYTLQRYNGGFSSNRKLRDHISTLILKYGFQAKLKHIYRDINNVIKVLKVPGKAHSSLGLESRHGFSVFNGLCFNGDLAHPKMECQLNTCRIMMAMSFLSDKKLIHPGGYEEMHDIVDAMDSIDSIIDNIKRCDVSLILCSTRIPSDIAQRLYLSGITCVTNADPGILQQLGLTLGKSIMETFDEVQLHKDNIATVECFRVVSMGKGNIVALSLGAMFHGCSILYSKSLPNFINPEHMKDLLKAGLFALQSLFEELNFVKNLEGKLRDDDSLMLSMCRFVGLKSWNAPSTRVNTYRKTPATSSRPFCKLLPINHNDEIGSAIDCSMSVLMSPKPRIGTKQSFHAYKVKRSNSFSSDALTPDKAKRQIFFSDWLNNYHNGSSDYPAASSPEATMISYEVLKEISSLECIEYYTKDGDICGNAIRKVIPIGIYDSGNFVSDFVSNQANNIQKSRCPSSDACSDSLRKHQLHLEISCESYSAKAKRVTFTFEPHDIPFQGGNKMSSYMLGVSCRICGDYRMLSVNDFTFGRFLHMLLNDRSYISECQHYLFANKDYSLYSEKLVVRIQVQDVSQYKVAAWLNAPLINCDVACLPLYEAVTERCDRTLMNATSTLLTVLERISDVEKEEPDGYSPPGTWYRNDYLDLGDLITFSWEPYDSKSVDLLYMKDRSSTMSLCLRNLFSMVMSFMDSKFSECILAENLEDELPCRCELRCEVVEEVQYDENSLWKIPLSKVSVSKFQEEYEDRNVYGLNMHPTLLGNITKAINGSGRFGMCKICKRCRYENTAELEILNWIYIITGITRNIGNKLQSLIIALEHRNVSGRTTEPPKCESSVVKESTDEMNTVGDEKCNTDTASTVSGASTVVKSSSVQESNVERTPPLAESMQKNMVNILQEAPDETLQNGNIGKSDENSVDTTYQEECKALDAVIDVIKNSMDDLRATYLQCVSHLLFSMFWSNLDEMNLYMSIRCFFLSYTQINRVVMQDVRHHAHYGMKYMRVIQDTKKNESARDRHTSAEPNHESSDSEGELSLYNSVSEDSTPRKHMLLRSSSTINEKEIMECLSHIEGYDDKRESPLHAKESDLNDKSLIDYEDNVPELLVEKQDTTRVNSPKSSRHTKNDWSTTYSSNRVWCPGWQVTLKADWLSIVNTAPESNLISDSNANAKAYSPRRNESILMFLQNSFDSSIYRGFSDIFSDPSTGMRNFRQLMARVHRGCCKHVQSLVSVDYDVIHQLRRDIGNIIASGIFSSEYVDLCHSNFQAPIRGNLCYMGKSLFSYCKKKRYGLMSHLYSGLGHAIHDVHLPNLTDKRKVNFGGFVLDSSFYSRICNHSYLESVFQLDGGAVILQPEDINHGSIFSMPPVRCTHETLLQNSWSAIADGDDELQIVNLICQWNSSKVVARNPVTEIHNAPSRVMCPVTKPCYMVPLFVCNNRLLNYAWCDHEKDFTGTPIMDDYMNMLFTNVSNEYQVLRAFVEGTLKHLMSICVKRAKTHRIVAYVSNYIKNIARDDYQTINKASSLLYGDVEEFLDNKGSPEIGLSPADTFVMEAAKPIRSFWTDNNSRYIEEFERNKKEQQLHESSANDHHDGFEWLRTHNGIGESVPLFLDAVQRSYNITVHYPEAFHMLRHLSCGDDISFVRSLCRSTRIRCSGGKSGAPLFASHDGKYILKFLNRYEFQLFMDKGKAYFKHILSGGTLLSIPYGLFSIEHIKSGSTVRCLIMQNIDRMVGVNKLLFDLKGVSYKRYVNMTPYLVGETNKQKADTGELDVSHGSSSPHHVVLLDQNFKDFTHGCPIHLGKEQLCQMFTYIRRDLDFLSRLDVVDYSLLLCVVPEEGTMFLGIIDYLRPYTWDKQIETIGKKLANIASGKTPTIISPFEYQARFMAFFSRTFSLPMLDTGTKKAPVMPEKYIKPKSTRIKQIASSDLDFIYTMPHVASLQQFMCRTSPVAKKYIEQLIKMSKASENTDVTSRELSKVIKEVYNTAVLDCGYNTL